MAIKVTVDATAAVSGLHELQKRHLPFALAKTLTQCAQAGQLATQNSLAEKFTLRNDFTRRGIRYKPASKSASAIEADVHTDTANRKSGAPDYLAPQEEGGEKVPHEGRQYLAVPTRYLRQMCPGVIPAELRPRNLLAAYNDGRALAEPREGKRPRARRTLGIVFFVQTLKSGHKAIMGRYFTDRDAYPYYLLIPEAFIKPRLEMGKTVTQAVEEAFPGLWADTWHTIMVRGLRFTY